MPYIALKPCEFGGKKYIVNDLIPDEVIAKPKKLIDAKIIAPQKGDINETVTTTDNFMFPILTNDGFVTQEVTTENLFEALTTVQKNADEVKKSVNECSEQEVLLMVYSLDSRKGVKDAVDKRLVALEAEETDEDETPEEAEETDEEQGDGE